MKKILLILLSITFYFLITAITNALNIFFPYTNLLLTALFIIVVFAYDANCDKIALVSYILFTLVFLFYRKKVEVNINLKFYLFTWLKIILKNKIVFINILGNILLFMPFVFFLKSKYYLLIIVLLVFGLELMQYLSRRGVMDIVDITLNLIGVIFAVFIKWRLYERQRKANK